MRVYQESAKYFNDNDNHNEKRRKNLPHVEILSASFDYNGFKMWKCIKINFLAAQQRGFSLIYSMWLIHRKSFELGSGLQHTHTINPNVPEPIFISHIFAMTILNRLIYARIKYILIWFIT